MTLNYSVGILGDMDISSFQAGINQIKQDLAAVDTQTKKTGSTLDLFGKGLKSGLGAIKNLSTAAAGALTGIGLTAPSLSGAMSRIKNEAFKTSEIFGRELQPDFEKFASGWSRFNAFLDSHPTFKKVATGGLEVLGVFGLMRGAFAATKWVFGGMFSKVAELITKSKTLKTLWSGIKTIFKGLGSKIGSALKTAASAVGGAILTTLGSIATTLLSGLGGGWLAQKISNALGFTSEDSKGVLASLKRIGVSVLGGGLTGAATGAAIGAFGGPIGAGAGALIGGAGGLIYAGGKEIYNSFFRESESEKSSSTTIKEPYPITQVPINNNIYLDGQQISSNQIIYTNNQISYLPGGAHQ